MSLSLRRLATGLRGRYHLWNGIRAYRSGAIRTAGRHLDEALSCGHESYTAFLTRGKIAYRQREVTRAVECFLRARDRDPTRFRVEGFPDDFLNTLRDQPDRVPPLRVRITIESGETPRRRRRTPVEQHTRGAQQLPTPEPPLGDFSSPEEAQRHAARPTIEPGAGAEVDWDAELGKLFDDD